MRRCLMVLAVLVALLLTFAVSAAPDDKTEARKLATAAGELLDTKHYAEALERVEQAEALFHAPTHLQMKGEALQGLGRLAEALDVFEKLAAEPLGDDAPGAFQHAQEFARDRMRALRKRVPSLLVRVNGAPADAVEVTLDGERFPHGAGEPRHVDAGVHALVVTADGFVTVERELTLDGDGDVHTVQVELVGTDADEADDSDEADDEDEDEGAGFYWPPWVAFGVGGAGLVVGIITGALSFSKVGELDDLCPDGRCTPAEQSLIDEAGTLGNVSTAGFIVGGVGVAAGVVLLLWRPGAGDEEEPSEEAKRRVRVTPWIGPSALGVEGTF